MLRLCSFLLLMMMTAAGRAHRPADISAFYSSDLGSAQPMTWDGGTDAAAIPLWPAGKVPGEHPGTIGNESATCLTKGVPVADCKDLSIHNVAVPAITPFLVKGADSAVIIGPGGGYGILAVNREGTDIAAWLNSIGVSAFVLKYRVPARKWLPFGSAPLMDAQV
jgi:hypothetical protein